MAAVNSVFCATLSSNSALFLFASALSTKSCLSNLSAFALWSAITPAALPSFIISVDNSLTDSVTLPIVSLTPVKVSTYELPADFASSIAPLKSPLNTFLIALPKNPIVSIALEILLVIFFTNASLKSSKACFGFSKTPIIKPPKAAILSVKTETVAPIIPSILLNLFCPSSEDVNAVFKARIPISNAPIPVAIIATFILFKLTMVVCILVFKAVNPTAAPPTAPPIVAIPPAAAVEDAPTAPIAAPVLAVAVVTPLDAFEVLFSDLFNPSTSFCAPPVSTFNLYSFTTIVYCFFN